MTIIDTSEAVSAKIAQIKSWFPDDYERQVSEAIKHGVPFVIDCHRCLGVEPATLDEAKASGWTNINLTDGTSYNFIGDCPECSKEAAQS